MKRSKPLYRIGDIIACYGKSDDPSDPNPENHLVIGWVEDIQTSNSLGHNYYVRWSDRQDRSLALIGERQMEPLRKLSRPASRLRLCFGPDRFYKIGATLRRRFISAMICSSIPLSNSWRTLAISRQNPSGFSLIV